MVVGSEPIGSGAATINAGHPTASQISNSAELNTALSDFLHGHDHSNGNIPRAFVNWILLDEHFNLVITNSGFEQVAAGNCPFDVCIPGGFGTGSEPIVTCPINNFLSRWFIIVSGLIFTSM